jgi:hypothetical protein
MAQSLKNYFFLSLLFSSFAYGSESEYKNILQTYEQLDQKNFSAWYNIGVLYEEMGSVGKATVAFVRAQRQAGLFEFERAGRQVCQMGNLKEVYGSAFYYYVYTIPLYSYQYIFLGFLFLFLWLWYRMMCYATKKRYAYIIFCCMTIIYSLYSMKYDWIYNPYAAIIDQQTDCFAGPDKSFVVVGSVKTPELYKIYKEQNEFCLIKNNGKMCWVYSKNLEKV